MLKMLCKYILVLLFVAFLLVIAGFYYYQKQITSPIAFNQNDVYTLESGQSIGHLAQTLVNEKLISESYSLKILARTKFKGQHIKAGDYQFGHGINLQQLMDQLVKGRVIQYRITIFEGWTFQRFLDALGNAKNLKQELTGLSEAEILAALEIDVAHPEGWFYPDTYIYSRRDSDATILKAAYNRMKKELDTAWETRNLETTTHIKSPYEALILASIIERETGVDEERALVSSVFHNRLRKKMLLQTDPTIIYGLGDSFDGDLVRSHLRDKDNIYNTYVYPGLTPTPIALPSKLSLQAALNPVASDYLYFVATGNGGHAFSRSYKDHKKAIQEYLKVLAEKRKADAAIEE